MPSQAQEKIKTWFENQYPENDVFLVDVQINIKSKIVLLIDGLEPILVKDCTKVSRSISPWLDEQDFIKEAYTLEVSSVGADAVLKNPLQFGKHIDREILIVLKNGESLQGILKKVSQENLTLLISKKEKGKKIEVFEHYIPSQNIESIQVIISFKEK